MLAEGKHRRRLGSLCQGKRLPKVEEGGKSEALEASFQWKGSFAKIV